MYTAHPSPLMNSKQFKAKRRRARQKLNKLKLKSKSKSLELQNLNDHHTPPPPSSSNTRSLLNKLVSFDHFTFDSNGVLFRPVHGIIIKTSDTGGCNEHVLTIKIIDNLQVSRRAEALLSVSTSNETENVITGTFSTLANFKVLD